MVQELTMIEERHFRVASHAVVLGFSHAILPHELPSNLISELPLACEQQTYFRTSLLSLRKYVRCSQAKLSQASLKLKVRVGPLVGAKLLIRVTCRQNSFLQKRCCT